MWPFPVTRAGSGCACYDAWRDEGSLGTAFLQNNQLNFQIGISAGAWQSRSFPASLPLMPFTVTCFKPSSSELAPIPRHPSRA